MQEHEEKIKLNWGDSDYNAWANFIINLNNGGSPSEKMTRTRLAEFNGHIIMSPSGACLQDVFFDTIEDLLFFKMRWS